MYRKKPEGWLKHLDFLIIDLIAFQMAYWLSDYIRHGFNPPFSDLMYRGYAFVAAVLLIVVVAWTNTFSDVLHRGFYRELISLIKTDLYVIGLSALYLFAIQQGSDFSRIVLGLTGAFYFVFAYAFRCLWKIVLRRKYAGSGKRDKLVFVTDADRVGSSLRSFLQSGMFDAELAGVVLFGIDNDGISAVDEELKNQIDVPIVAGTAGVEEFLQKTWVDEVFVDIPETSDGYDRLMDLLAEMGTVTHLRVGGPDGFVGKEKLIQYVGSYPVVTISTKLLTWRQSFAKRMIDIVGGLIGCLITLVLTIVLAPVIFIKSPGRIFFSQIRIGRNGKRFRMYKFRTMVPDAENRKQELTEKNIYTDGRMFKMETDPRIIGSRKRPGHGIGFFLRRTSIDEFPQFFNVLIGNMSLVGTRPPTPDEWERYEAHHRSRLTIKPGITGLWQVSGRNEITDFDEVVRLDREYIENWSMKLDIEILFRTIGAVCRGQ